MVPLMVVINNGKLGEITFFHVCFNIIVLYRCPGDTFQGTELGTVCGGHSPSCSLAVTKQRVQCGILVW